jgi:phage baseplate assembly protein gpV
METQVTYKDKIIKGVVEEINGYEATINLPQYQNTKEYGVWVGNIGSGSNQLDFAPSVGDNVLLAFDHDGDCYILQTWYSTDSDRPFSDSQKGAKYSDGKKNYYDIDLSKYIIDAASIELTSADNWAVKYTELLAVLSQILTIFNAHVHDSTQAAAPGNFSGVSSTQLTYVPTTVQSLKVRIG